MRQDRWSFKGTGSTPLEERLAPVVTPAFWRLRLLVLLVIQWVFVVVVTLCYTLLPVCVGRCLLTNLFVPAAWQHDPVNAALGLCVLNALFNCVRTMMESRLWTSEARSRRVAALTLVLTVLASLAIFSYALGNCIVALVHWNVLDITAEGWVAEQRQAVAAGTSLVVLVWSAVPQLVANRVIGAYVPLWIRDQQRLLQLRYIVDLVEDSGVNFDVVRQSFRMRVHQPVMQWVWSLRHLHVDRAVAVGAMVATKLVYAATTVPPSLTPFHITLIVLRLIQVLFPPFLPLPRCFSLLVVGTVENATDGDTARENPVPGSPIVFFSSVHFGQEQEVFDGKTIAKRSTGTRAPCSFS